MFLPLEVGVLTHYSPTSFVSLRLVGLERLPTRLIFVTHPLVGDYVLERLPRHKAPSPNPEIAS